MTVKNKIENFFVGEYNDIVENQLEANDDDDFQTDETLTKHIKVKISAYCVTLNVLYRHAMTLLKEQ